MTLIAAVETPTSDPSDERLMELIHDGGLEVLYKRYAPLLKRLSLKVLHSHDDAEDLLQDVFVEIWKRAGTYNPLKGRPLAWIATVTRRRSIDRLRRRDVYESTKDRSARKSDGCFGGWTHVQEDIAQGERS